MAIVLRFVDGEGMIQERLLDLVHVKDTLSATLKSSLWKILLKNQFDVYKIRGQGYNGASNMRGQWNGLKALVLGDVPSAYYVHCFAHRLQLALVGASKDVIPVNQFFTNLGYVINVVCASSKRHDELEKQKAKEIKELLELGEINSGKGLNQVGTLRRSGDTRWGSHYDSVCSMIDMFAATNVVLEGIMDDRDHTTSSQRAEADVAYNFTQSYEFVFILHLIKEVMGITNSLSQDLQKKSQDILNAMDLVKSTKVDLNNFRNKNWVSFLDGVTYFCKKHKIEMPNMNAPYKASSRCRARITDLHVTYEHYYRVDLFIATFDKYLDELNSRFSDQTMELLSLSSSLASKEIDVDRICLLVDKYYSEDFNEQDKFQLSCQLRLFNADRTQNPRLSGASTLSDLCKILVTTNKRETYFLLDRVVRLILTLPVSTATTERGFSAMKLIKARLRNRMSDEYLTNSLLIYVEKELAELYDPDCIIDEFKNLKDRRADL